MAAVVASLARVLQPAMAIPGGEPGCQGLAPWYLLLGLRLVALFIADTPWSSAKPDLACNWTSGYSDIRPFCRALCFNQHFSSAVSTVWGFAFMAALLPVGLMRLLRSGLKHEIIPAKGSDVELTPPGTSMGAVKILPPNMPAHQTDMTPSDSKRSSSCAWHAVAFGFCVVLLLIMELCFLWVVISLQLPLVSKATFLCLPGAQSCPAALECAVAGQADKQVALWALAFTAIVDVAACLAYLALSFGKASRGHRSRQNQ